MKNITITLDEDKAWDLAQFFNCYDCGGWKVVDDEDVCKDCAEEARRNE